MATASLLQDYEIDVKNFAIGKLPATKQYFFQIIFVTEGIGEACVNGQKLHFTVGDVFLLKPEDELAVTIASAVSFICIRFNRVYFTNRKFAEEHKPDFTSLFKRFEYIVYGSRETSKIPLNGTNDKQLLQLLLERIVEESQRTSPKRERFIQNLLVVILHILIQNIQSTFEHITRKSSGGGSVYEVIDYLNFHIYDNSHLKLSHLAEVFHTSRESLQRLFKRQTGTSIKQYISEYKLKLAAARLVHSKLTVSEIADDLGYTDVSHFTKAFRSYYGMSALEYRKKNTLQPSFHEGFLPNTVE